MFLIVLCDMHCNCVGVGIRRTGFILLLFWMLVHICDFVVVLGWHLIVLSFLFCWNMNKVIHSNFRFSLIQCLYTEKAQNWSLRIDGLYTFDYLSWWHVHGYGIVCILVMIEWIMGANEYFLVSLKDSLVSVDWILISLSCPVMGWYMLC